MVRSNLKKFEIFSFYYGTIVGVGSRKATGAAGASGRITAITVHSPYPNLFTILRRMHPLVTADVTEHV
jgi:hypothetical protein